MEWGGESALSAAIGVAGGSPGNRPTAAVLQAFSVDGHLVCLQRILFPILKLVTAFYQGVPRKPGRLLQETTQSFALSCFL